jgi:membrane protein DedA with SNARE-associated domain
MSASLEMPAFITLLAQSGPIGIGAVALAEKFLPMVPSYIVFMLVGMMAASGHSELVVAVAATAIGSTIGALGWYGLGLAVGPTRIEVLIERFGRFIFLKPALYHRMARAYRRNHFWVTVVGQTIPVVRIYLSIPAGVLNLAVLNFLGATLIGSIIWSGPLLTLGYVLRERSADAAFSGLLVVAVLVGFEFLVLLSWRLTRHPGRPPQDHEGAGQQQNEHDRDAADPADAELQRIGRRVHAEWMQQPRQQQRAHQQMDPHGCQAGHLQHRHHQCDDRHVFDEVGMRTDRPAQLEVSVVAEHGPVSLTQSSDLNRKDCIE